MSVKVILELHVQPEFVEQVKAGFREFLVDTRAREGCEEVAVLQSQNDPDILVVLQQWATRSAYESYLTWRTDRGDIANIATFSSAPHSVSFYDYVPA